jgi:hypothetical protein
MSRKPSADMIETYKDYVAYQLIKALCSIYKINTKAIKVATQCSERGASNKMSAKATAFPLCYF